MKQSPYYFEIKDMLTQFVTAFDDIVIKRYNVNRKVEDKINVRYAYAPKQRVLHDIIDTAQNITLPAVAVTIGGISRDSTRVFNKLEGFYYTGSSGTSSSILKAPVPINITVNVSIITKFQTDMDQILSNFIPYSNPYIVISWKVPQDFGLPSAQEIRSEVLWSGDLTMEYPVDLTGTQKSRIVADTTFTIKGWLFKEQTSDVSNIYYINTNFYTENILTDYETLSAIDYAVTETFTVSANPSVTNIYFDTVPIYDMTVNLNPGMSGNIVLVGTGFTNIDGILLSSDQVTLFNNLTSINTTVHTKTVSITGQLLQAYTTINDEIINFILPPLYPNFRHPNAKLAFVPFNKAGFDSTDKL